MRQTWFVVVLAFTLAWTLPAQDAISAKAGMVNYFEGRVSLDGEPLKFKVSTFHQIPEGGKLEADAEGRAEVLLSPGVLLWLGEGGAIELVSDDLADAKVRLLAGAIVVSASEFPKGVMVTVLAGEDEIRISEPGIFKVDFGRAEIAVQEGRVDVLRADGTSIRVRKERSLALGNANASLVKIDKNEPADALMLWARSRDHHIQVANLSAAREMQTSGFTRGMSFASLGMYSSFGTWFYNPYFGMYTFVPFGQGLMSPWGAYYWTPRTVGQVYYPGIWAGNSGARANSRMSVSRSGFSNNAAFGGYSRGASVGGSGGFGVGDIGGRGPISVGIGGGGGYSRGASSMGGSVGGGGSVGSPPTSSGGASMGRGSASAGRTSGGGRGN